MDIVKFNPGKDLTHPNLCNVEMYLGGVGMLCFPDGTVQFADGASWPDVVYSPRMEEDDLELFCATHISKYKEYFRAYIVDLRPEGGEGPPIEPFWVLDYETLTGDQ